MPTHNPALDDLLLDVATIIELSDNDRRIANVRYANLKAHLESETSALAYLFRDERGLIYPQGSVLTGTTVLTGENDRFDLDAIVEAKWPHGWSPRDVLNNLFDALQGFPDVRKIERCTRAIQLQFATMHLDVTPMEPEPEPRKLRAGEIFSAPDKGPDGRFDSNAWAFGMWFRERMVPNVAFAKIVQARRGLLAVSRLKTSAATQDKLPEYIPPREDTQRVVALKLLKRFVKMRYAKRETRWPPSVYFALFAGNAIESDDGLLAQLEDMALSIIFDLQTNIDRGTKPDHRNPEMRTDRINDRWPENRAGMELLLSDLHHLLKRLEQAKRAEVKNWPEIFDDLFGERVSKPSIAAYVERSSVGADASASRIIAGRGTIVEKAAIASPAIVRVTRDVPPHNFHSAVVRKKK